MPTKQKRKPPIGVGLTAKQMKRKKPINIDLMRDVETLTPNQEESEHDSPKKVLVQHRGMIK